MIDKDSMILLTTEDLVGELKRRHPDGCMVGFQFPPHEARSVGQSWRITFSGDFNTTLKLANIGMWLHQKAIMGDIHGGTEPV